MNLEEEFEQAIKIVRGKGDFYHCVDVEDVIGIGKKFIKKALSQQREDNTEGVKELDEQNIVTSIIFDCKECGMPTKVQNVTKDARVITKCYKCQTEWETTFEIKEHQTTEE